MPAKNIQAHDGSGIRAAVAEPPASPPKSAREPKSGERLQTPEETADFLRVSLSWLAKARMRGDGPPFVKIGRSIRYPESVLHQAWGERGFLVPHAFSERKIGKPRNKCSVD